MTKPINTEGIEKATGKPWSQWLETLDNLGAKELTHKEIARKLYDLLDGTIDNHGWWAQGITVAYEQHIGRRAPGQRSDGTFEVSVSKTVLGTMDEAFSSWKKLADMNEYNGVTISGAPTMSETLKWRNWRVNLEDGTKVVVGINQKDSERAMIGLAHQKLDSSKSVEKWRSFWKEFFENL